MKKEKIKFDGRDVKIVETKLRPTFVENVPTREEPTMRGLGDLGKW